MGGNIVNLIINCFKRGSGVEEVEKDLDEAKKQAGLFAKGLEALGGTANGVGRMLRGVLTGGLWEAGARGAMLLVEKFKEWKERSTEAAREVVAEFGKGFDTVTQVVEEKLKRIVGALARAAARAKEMMGLENARRETLVSSEMLDLHEQERQELAKERNDSERAIIQANYKIKQSRIEDEEKLRRARAECTESENAYYRAVKEAQAAREAATDQNWMVEAAWAKLELAMAKDDEQMVKTAQEIMNKAKEAAEKARERAEAADAKVVSAQEAYQVSLQKRATLTNEIQDRERQLEYNLAEAKRKAAEQADERTRAEQKAAQLAELHEKTREELQQASCENERKVIRAYEKVEEALIEAADKEGDMSAKDAVDKARFELAETIDKIKLEEQRKDVKAEIDAEKERAANEQRRFNDSIAKLLKEIADIEKRREKTEKGKAVDHQNHSWNPYEYRTDKDGKISFTDWLRTRRYGDETNDEAKARRRREQDDKRMEKLEDKWKDGKKLSDREMKQLRDWWDYQEEVNGRDRRQAQIEKLQKEAAEAAKKSARHLKNLDDKVKKLVEEGPLD